MAIEDYHNLAHWGDDDPNADVRASEQQAAHTRQIIDYEGAFISDDPGRIAALGITPVQWEASLELLGMLALGEGGPYGPGSRAHQDGDPWEGLQADPLPRNAAGAPVGDWRYDAFKRRLRSRRGR